MFYFGVFLILCVFGFLEITSIGSLYKRILFVCSILMLWFIIALRYETGGDWTTYTEVFRDIEPLEKVLSGEAPIYESSYMEPAYKLMNVVVKSMGGNVQWIFLIIGTLNAFLLYQSLKKYSLYPILSVLIYFCSLSFSLDMIAMRQAVAVQFFFLSLVYVHQRRFWPFLLLLTAAFLFHRSCILLFPLYWVLHKDFSLKQYNLIFFISAAIFFLQVRWMTGLLTVVADVIGGNNGGIIKMYLSSETFSANRSLSVGVLINFLLYALFISRRRELQRLPYFSIFFNLFILNLVVFFVFYEFIEISNRYRFYFLLGSVVLLPYLISICKDRLLRLVAYAGIVGFSFLYGRTTFLEDPAAIAFNPYQNYLMHILFDTKSDGEQRLKESDSHYNESRKN